MTCAAATQDLPSCCSRTDSLQLVLRLSQLESPASSQQVRRLLRWDLHASACLHSSYLLHHPALHKFIQNIITHNFVALAYSVSERGDLRMMDLRMVPGPHASSSSDSTSNLPQGETCFFLLSTALPPSLFLCSVHSHPVKAPKRFYSCNCTACQTLAGLSPYDTASAATYKSVPAHSKGGVSALVAHSHAPLMATGTNSQVVKVWTDECDVVRAFCCTTLRLTSSLRMCEQWNCLKHCAYSTALHSLCLTTDVQADATNFSLVAGGSDPPSIDVHVPKTWPCHMHGLAPLPTAARCRVWRPYSDCVRDRSGVFFVCCVNKSNA